MWTILSVTYGANKKLIIFQNTNNKSNLGLSLNSF